MLGELPNDLHHHAQQLTFELALRASNTGDPRDAFMGVDRLPLLSVGSWLLEDLMPARGEPARDSRADLERSLFVASFLRALSELAVDSMADPTSFFDERHVEIAKWCDDHALSEIGGLIPGSVGDGVSVVEQAARDPGPSGMDPPIRGRWSSTAIPTVLVSGRLAHADDQQIATIGGLLGNLCVAFQIWDELDTLKRDLTEGRVTYPIAVIAHAGRIRTERAPPPLQILGAMVATSALHEILDKASDLLAASRQRAAQLKLRTWTSFLDDVAATDAERRARLIMGKGLVDVGVSPGVSFSLEESAPQKAIAMADAFLLSDLTFRESWETHREGMLGADEVSARFPAGLILEILCRTGHKLQDAVDEFIAQAVNNGFRYYDHPASDPDSDTVGAALRLLRYAGEAKRPPAGLTSMIGCIDRLLDERGEIPVWLGACAQPNPERPPTLTLGSRCGTVAAHLLLGLADLGDEYAALLRRGTSALFDRIADVGLGANVNYPPRYALAMYFRLLQNVGSGTDADAVRNVLNGELERRSDVAIDSAQEAALAVLAARAAHRPELIQPAWKTTILKGQSSDGSWIGEPFAVAPNRGWHVSAYSSTTLTTALCYDALAGTDEDAPAEG